MPIHWLKKMLGMDPASDSDDFLKGKDPAEALAELREYRRGDEERRQRALMDVDVLAAKEKEIFEQAKNETSDAKKMILVKRIKDIRAKIADINNKIAIYDKRIKIYATHIQNLEVIHEAQVDNLPDREALEKGAFVARTELDKLNEAAITAEGVGVRLETPTMDSAEQAILAEINSAVEREIDANDPLLAEIEAAKAADEAKAATKEEPPKTEEAKKDDIEKMLEG